MRVVLLLVCLVLFNAAMDCYASDTLDIKENEKHIQVGLEVLGLSSGTVSGILEYTLWRSQGLSTHSLHACTGIGTVDPSNGYVTIGGGYSYGADHRLEVTGAAAILYKQSDRPQGSTVEPYTDAPVVPALLLGYRCHCNGGFTLRIFFVYSYDPRKSEYPSRIRPGLGIGWRF